MDGVSQIRMYGGLLPEQRRAQRREQLLDAALDLVGEEGVGALTMRRLIARAGLAPRYFYESFAGLEKLRLALFDRVNEELLHAALASLEGGDGLTPRAATQRALTAMVDVLAQDPRKGRVMRESVGTPELAARRAEAANRASGLLVAAAASRLDDAADTARVEFVARFVVGGFTETIAHWIDHPDEVDRRQVIHNCTELFLAAGTVLDRLV